VSSGGTAILEPSSVTRVELSRQTDVSKHLIGDPEIGQDRLPDPPGSGQLHQHRERSLRQRLEQLGVDPDGQLRGVGSLGEQVHHIARSLGLGVRKVERLPVETGLVRDVIHRSGDVIDWDDVRVPELGPDQRKPARQVVPCHLDRGEEVVRTVDLVHLARLR
jgi:hypothetical protein